MITRRAFLQTAAGAAAAVSLIRRPVTVAPTRPVPRAHAVFLVPHQDDETLSFAAEILAAHRGGKVVSVVYFGDGTASAARAVLNGEVDCGWHHRRHDPAAEGRAWLDPAGFASVRYNEARRACAELGVRAERVQFLGIPETHITVEQVAAHLPALVGNLPRGSVVYAPTPWERTSGLGNPDHGNIGLALQDAAESGMVTATTRYTLFPRYRAHAAQVGAWMVRAASANEDGQWSLAAAVYRQWDPAAGRLAVGYHSVAGDFNYLAGNHVGYTHKGP